jgi:hypothetical protein
VFWPSWRAARAEYRSRFFEAFLPKAMAVKSPDEERNRQIADEEMKIEEMKRILVRYRLHQDEELAEGVSDDVGRKTRRVVAEWVDRFELDLPPKAVDVLGTHVAALVEECAAEMAAMWSSTPWLLLHTASRRRWRARNKTKGGGE